MNCEITSQYFSFQEIIGSKVDDGSNLSEEKCHSLQKQNKTEEYWTAFYRQATTHVPTWPTQTPIVLPASVTRRTYNDLYRGWVKICGPGQGAKTFFKWALGVFFQKIGGEELLSKKKGAKTYIYWRLSPGI